MENQISQLESLALIDRMISSAKNNLQKGTGNIFLLWGYLIGFLSLATLVMLLTLPVEQRYSAYLVWWLTPAGVLVHFFLVRRLSQVNLVETYIDKVMSYVWIAFTISVFVLVMAMIFAGLRPDGSDLPGWIPWTFMVPFMLILYGFALFVSGRAYRFKPLVSGSFVCWAMVLLCFFLYGSRYMAEIQQAAMLVAVTAGYIVPGHLLKMREDGKV